MFDTLCGLEKRAEWIVGPHPQDPVLAEILGLNRDTLAGVEVDRISVLGYPAVWRGVNLISGDVGKLPLLTFRNLPGGGKERAKDHPIYRLLRRRPNEFMIAPVFKQTLMAHALLEGNGYAFIMRNGAGTPIELLPLLPDRTFPVIENGQLWYVTRVGNEQRKLNPSNVLHIPGLSYNGILGYSLIEIAAGAFGLGMAAQRFGSAFFGNGSHMDGILFYPSKLKPEAIENLRDGWSKMHQGVQRSHRLAIMQEGVKFEQMTIPNEQSQFTETRAFEIRQIANLLNCPPHKLGDDSRTSFSSLEQENRSYLEQCLDPWLVKWEEEMYDKLLTEEEKEKEELTIEFLREALTRADTATETSVMVEQVNNGLLTLDEARARKNLPPVPGDEGKKHRIPMNIGVIGEDTPDLVPAPGDPIPVPDEDEPEPDEDEDDDRTAAILDAHYTVIRKACQRALKIIGAKAVRKASEPKTFTDWVDNELINDHTRQASDIMNESMDPWAVFVGMRWRWTVNPCGHAYDRLLKLSESCTPAQLPAAVETLTRDWLTEIPDQIIEDLKRAIARKDDNDGTET